MTLGLTKVIWVMASVFFDSDNAHSAPKCEKNQRFVFLKKAIDFCPFGYAIYLLASILHYFFQFLKHCAMLHLASRARAENKIKDSSNFNICSKKTLTLAVKHTRLKYNTYYSLELGLGMYTVLFLMFFLLSFK